MASSRAPLPASSALLAAATAALFAAGAGACSDDSSSASCPTPSGPDGGTPALDGSTPDAQQATDSGTGEASDGGIDGAATGPVVTSTTVDKTMTYAKFADLCEKRGGIVQTHAACSGNNSCKGLSFNKFSSKLTEHTCRAMNSCGGFSCVDLAPDSGLDGEKVFEQGGCLECHQYQKPKTEFTVYVREGTDPTAGVAAFSAKSKEALVTAVAFGVSGINPDGTAFHNMPAYYKRFSLGEIRKVVDYVKNLTPVADVYDPTAVGTGDGGMQ